MKFTAFLAAALAVCLPAYAQVPAPNDAGIAMGHLHFTAKDKAAQTKFWVEVMGAKPAKLGALDVLLIPGTLLIVNQGNATGDQFRTAPLWGIGQRYFFLHDGRTQDIVQAIELHRSPGDATYPASEANTVINNFDALQASDQQDLINFLRSL